MSSGRYIECIGMSERMVLEVHLADIFTWTLLQSQKSAVNHDRLQLYQDPAV